MIFKIASYDPFKVYFVQEKYNNIQDIIYENKSWYLNVASQAKLTCFKDFWTLKKSEETNIISHRFGTKGRWVNEDILADLFL